MSKRILYLSVHEILEYDELLLFKELGFECFSLGAYTQPGGQENRKRPPLDLPYDPHFIELSLQYPKEALHPEMLEGIDIVIIMHNPKYIEGNWPLFEQFMAKGGRVIWRSIGQSVPGIEERLRPFRKRGLEIVRYSPAEDTIAGHVGSDVMIRFYKDPEEYKGWTGNRRQVVNFTQGLKSRGDHTGYKLVNRVFESLPAKVYGPGNEDLGIMSGGLVSYDEQMDIFREARVFFYHGTYPASYTLSLIEAWMTGTPVVAVGPANGNGSMYGQQRTYEVPELISSGVDGFVSDRPEELRKYCQELLADHPKAKAISTFGRNKAISLFGKAKIKEQWQEFLR